MEILEEDNDNSLLKILYRHDVSHGVQLLLLDDNWRRVRDAYPDSFVAGNPVEERSQLMYTSLPELRCACNSHPGISALIVCDLPVGVQDVNKQIKNLGDRLKELPFNLRPSHILCDDMNSEGEAVYINAGAALGEVFPNAKIARLSVAAPRGESSFNKTDIMSEFYEHKGRIPSLWRWLGFDESLDGLLWPDQLLLRSTSTGSATTLLMSATSSWFRDDESEPDKVVKHVFESCPQPAHRAAMEGYIWHAASCGIPEGWDLKALHEILKSGFGGCSNAQAGTGRRMNLGWFFFLVAVAGRDHNRPWLASELVDHGDPMSPEGQLQEQSKSLSRAWVELVRALQVNENNGRYSISSVALVGSDKLVITFDYDIAGRLCATDENWAATLPGKLSSLGTRWQTGEKLDEVGLEGGVEDVTRSAYGAFLRVLGCGGATIKGFAPTFTCSLVGASNGRTKLVLQVLSSPALQTREER